LGTTATEPIQIRGPVSFLRWLFDLLHDTYNLWFERRTIRLGAGLAYYGIFAVIPLLTLSVALAQVIFSDAQVQEFLTEQFQAIFGQPEATDLAAKITEILNSGATTSSLGLIGLVSLIITASLVREPLLLRLFAVSLQVLEKDLDSEASVALNRRRKQRIDETAIVLNERIPTINIDHAHHFLRRIGWVVAGLAQASASTTVAAQLENRPEVIASRVDFSTELQSILTVLLQAVDASP